MSSLVRPLLHGYCGALVLSAWSSAPLTQDFGRGLRISCQLADKKTGELHLQSIWFMEAAAVEVVCLFVSALCLLLKSFHESQGWLTDHFAIGLFTTPLIHL